MNLDVGRILYIAEQREAEAKRFWLDYVANNQLPPDIPPNPDEVYKDRWRGWCDWLGWNENDGGIQ